jgi:hypothetical protein
MRAYYNELKGRANGISQVQRPGLKTLFFACEKFLMHFAGYVQGSPLSLITL